MTYEQQQAIKAIAKAIDPTTPAGTDHPSGAAAAIRELKTAVRQALLVLTGPPYPKNLP